MYEIAHETLASAEQCHRNHACLNEKTPPLCHVKDCVNNEIHFVATNILYCKYFVFFADEVICTCPVRKELFNKYKV